VDDIITIILQTVSLHICVSFGGIYFHPCLLWLCYSGVIYTAAEECLISISAAPNTCRDWATGKRHMSGLWSSASNFRETARRNKRKNSFWWC